MPKPSSRSISSWQNARPLAPSTSCVSMRQLGAPSGQNQMNGILSTPPLSSRRPMVDRISLSTLTSTGQCGNEIRSHPLREILCNCFRTVTDSSGSQEVVDLACRLLRRQAAKACPPAVSLVPEVPGNL